MKRTEQYTGPFPRKRHSHRCEACAVRGQMNSVACYKSQCTKAQLVEHCQWCTPVGPSVTNTPPVRVIPAVAAALKICEPGKCFSDARTWQDGKRHCQRCGGAVVAAALPVGTQLDLFGVKAEASR